MTLRAKLIRLAKENPELRKDLLPLLAEKTAGGLPSRLQGESTWSIKGTTLTLQFEITLKALGIELSVLTGFAKAAKHHIAEAISEIFTALKGGGLSPSRPQLLWNLLIQPQAGALLFTAPTTEITWDDVSGLPGVTPPSWIPGFVEDTLKKHGLKPKKG